VALRRVDEQRSQPWDPVPTCTDPRPLAPAELVAV